MAKNSMTPEQDVITREFYTMVARYGEDLLPSSPVSARKLRSILLELLNYDILPNGVFVIKGTQIHHKLGKTDYSMFKNEWPKDLATARAQVRKNKNEANRDKNTRKARASKSASYPEIRKALLSKDVS